MVYRFSTSNMDPDQAVGLLLVALYVLSAYGFILVLLSMWNTESPPETVDKRNNTKDS